MQIESMLQILYFCDYLFLYFYGIGLHNYIEQTGTIDFPPSFRQWLV